MIRYPTTAVDLEAAVDAHDATWRAKAQQRTGAFRLARCYDEKTGIWSDIKAVFMQLQHSKCAYCERRLEGPPYGAIEHDVEHFRPKSSVKKWPPKTWPPTSIAKRTKVEYKFATGDAWAEGYYLLAYHLRNYATACKVCNSVLKSNYFPIYGLRGPQRDDPALLAGELPLLIYPLGDLDNDPEELITFNGTVPIPTKQSGYDAYRARVTIDFFALETREHLREDRALQIRQLWLVLIAIAHAANEAERAAWEARLDRVTSPTSPHTNCVRAFHRLCQDDYAAARTIYEAVEDYLAKRGL